MNQDKASKTARKVALNILSLGAVRGMEDVLPRGIVEATARLLVASGEVGAAAVRFARSRAAVGLYRAFDWMMPGQFEAFGYRKAFCERQVRESVDAGATQVLVLGAGYDTLGWRLGPELKGVTFFEIDHPATANAKARGIEAMGARPNLRLLAEDLGRRPLVEVLRGESRWDATARTVIVAEGLLMYLSPEAVETLLQQCAAVTGPGSRLAFTYVGSQSDGRPDAGPWTWLVLWLLRTGGEPWLWSLCPQELGPFLEANHWRMIQDGQDPPERHGVEFYGVAEK